MAEQTSLSPVSVIELESLLDKGMIACAMRNGNWWRLRRNGQTKRWKRDPDRFRIPIKAGMYAYGELTEADCPGGILNSQHYRLIAAQ